MADSKVYYHTHYPRGVTTPEMLLIALSGVFDSLEERAKRDGYELAWDRVRIETYEDEADSVSIGGSVYYDDIFSYSIRAVGINNGN